MEEIDLSKLPKKERKKLKREMERQEEEKKNRMAKIVKWSIVGLLALLLLLGGWWVYTELSNPLPGRAVEDQGRGHVPKEEWEKFSYNSTPPTSGPHDQDWKRAGEYNEQQGDGYLVHSLEHGYIVMSYNCPQNDQECLNFVDKLKERANKDSYKLILVPRSTLDSHFALTA